MDANALFSHPHPYSHPHLHISLLCLGLLAQQNLRTVEYGRSLVVCEPDISLEEANFVSFEVGYSRHDRLHLLGESFLRQEQTPLQHCLQLLRAVAVPVFGDDLEVESGAVGENGDVLPLYVALTQQLPRVFSDVGAYA